MPRRTLLALAVLLGGSLEAQAPPPPSTAEFPAYDRGLLEPFEAARNAREAARALERDPASVATFTLLVDNRQHDAALGVLEAILARHPDQLTAVVMALRSRAYANEFDDEASGRLERLRALVRAIKTQLPSLPREDAAWIDYGLINVDSRLDRTGSRHHASRLLRIEQLYPGTDAARMAEVDRIAFQLPMSTRVQALEKFARSHPGTIEGAKALFQAAFDWGHNMPEDKVGEEPSARFAKVVSMARELESGAWPVSEWVTRAPSLVTDFHAYRPRHSPEGIRLMLDLYREFIASHFVIGEENRQSSVLYLITTKIPELLRAGGDASLAGMEPLFDEWSRIPGQREAVRFTRAQMFERQSQDQRGVDRTMWRTRTIEALTDLAAGDGLQARRALATLASLYFRERDFASAAKTYAKYLDLYPQTAWSWVARLRLGQSHEELRNWPAASSAYRAAAADPGGNVMSRVFGFLHAARAAHAVGSYDEALRLYRSAREAWDSAYAQPYGIPAYVLTSHLTSPGGALKSAAPVSKAVLESMIERLEIATTDASGHLLERGRWLVENGQWAEGRAALERFLAMSPRSPHARVARYRANVAHLQEALDRAGVESASPDAAGALAMLDTLTARAWDPAVGVARIARACLLLLNGDATGAEQAMRAALTEWHAKQSAPPGRGPLQGLEEDVAEIRKVAFRPAGGDPYTRERRWEAFPKAVLPPFATVKPQLPVKLSDGSVVMVSAFRHAADVPPVLFFDEEQIALLYTVVGKLGGSRTREPGQIMEVPNQPVGGSMTIVNLWNRFFNAVPGHWGGWMFETPPTVTRIEFLNRERTKASAFVTIRYEGATLMMEKIGGAWKVTGITNRWIT